MSRFSSYIKKLFEAGISYPKGWSQESARKWVESFQKSHNIPKSGEGFFDACVLHMTDEMGEGAKGFCASMKDEWANTTYWRGKGKEPKEAKKLAKKHPLSQSKD